MPVNARVLDGGEMSGAGWQADVARRWLWRRVL